MKKLWQMVLIALVGICVGAALDEAVHVVRNRQSQAIDRDSNELFQRRVRCKSLADDFVKKSSDESTNLLLERVEYSPARHSCIGAFTRVHGRRGTLYSFEAIDILTGETLYSGECTRENDANSRFSCGNGRDVQLIEKRDETLESALSKEP